MAYLKNYGRFCTLRGLGANVTLASLQQQREALKTQIDKMYRERSILARKLRSFKDPWLGFRLVPENIVVAIEGGDFVLSDVERKILNAVGILKEVEMLISALNSLQKQLQSIEDAIAGYKEEPAYIPPSPSYIPPPPQDRLLTSQEQRQIALLPDYLRPGYMMIQPEKAKPAKEVLPDPPSQTWLERYWYIPPIGILVLAAGGIAYSKLA